MIEAGTEASDFELATQDGEPLKLSDYRGQIVVLYFYPKADTGWGKRHNDGAPKPLACV
jgi:peroxiredoxin Q/BCP